MTMTNSASLLIGIPEFSEPTLLILGDEESLRELSDHIASRRDIAMASLAPKVWSSVPLHLEPTRASQGKLQYQGESLVWQISESEAREFAHQLRTLATSPIPAHMYLDPPENPAGLEIMASKGEYSPKVFDRDKPSSKRS